MKKVGLGFAVAFLYTPIYEISQYLTEWAKSAILVKINENNVKNYELTKNLPDENNDKL